MKKMFLVMSILVMVLALAGTQTIGAAQPQSDRMSGEQQIAEEMLGKTVQNQQGQNVGRVLALATRNGEIAYILIAKNGNPRELTPIPFSATYFDVQTDAVVLSVSDSELAQAPSISIDELQKLDDPEFESQVHGYYGREPADGQKESRPMKEFGQGMQQVGAQQ